MRRAVAGIFSAGAICVAAAGAAQAEPRNVVPVPGATACTTRPPVLLTAGRGPHRQLRFDLAKVANRSQSITLIDRVDMKTLDAAGTWRRERRTDTIKGSFRTGKLAGGRLSTRTRATLSGPSYPTRPTITLDGYTDDLGGGVTGGDPDNDHLPREAVGRGATWRVVNCDEVGQIHAKETRTYTLRSVAHGVVELTFRDVVTIDRGQLAMGSQKVGGRTVKLEAVTLQGSATGTRSVPLANVLAQSVRSVTRARISVHVISPNQPTLLLQLRLVETQTAGPTA